MQRHLSRSARLSALAFGALGVTFFANGDANAQVSGTSSRPLPDVLLLVDTSGSMERMVDPTVTTTCTPGVYTDANRWGILVQSLTGNIEPYFSCNTVPRTANSDFTKRYGIANKPPYDTDYIFDYHQPISGPDATTACALVPWHLPGAGTGQGVGNSTLGAGGNPWDYPDNALAQVKVPLIQPLGAYAQGITDASAIPDANSCVFSQNNDGQLDATKYYARFALMTFDSDTSGKTGLTAGQTAIDFGDPFTGQWSYLRSNGNVYYDGSACKAGTAFGCNDTLLGAQGLPGTTPACTTITPQEVGARNRSAPPWEGRLINFPSSDATIYEMDTQNNQIQQTLIATRPSGATPLDGMMDDARDFYWNYPGGPKDDSYSCRDRYIIILTDGAPNLDLRPSCAAAHGVCPYPDTAGTIANSMRLAVNPVQHVTTFVIGFAVSGSSETGGTGFPTGLSHNDCKTWFTNAAGGATDPLTRATNMQNVCTSMRSAGTLTTGTTADACCKLNDVAIQGGQTGAFFAESQADITLAFGRILANIIHSASTKTIPVFSPAVQFNAAAFASSGATTASAAEYIASYIPSSQRPWSGEIDRTRFLCSSANVSTNQPEAASSGDFESENVAEQSAHGNRIFVTVVGDNASSQIDSQASIRPFANGGTADSTGGDKLVMPSTNAPTYPGREVVMTTGYNLHFVTPATDWPLALNVTKNTCQRGRAVDVTLGTDIIPALNDATNGPSECSDVVWGFTTADPNSISFAGDPPSAGTYNFNTRCPNGTSGTVLNGTCSITGGHCVPGGATSPCPTGEVCVPLCAALGAIYHSTPAVVPPPQTLLREEGFRTYQANRAARRTVMYAASTDGILHGFKALEQGDPSKNHELWSFVPPAVLPTLASNYPGGNQILLDGAPIVRETVFDRSAGNTSSAKDWHTSLVAGLGGFGGYYAVNVTDADCQGSSSGDCLAGGYAAPTEGQSKEAWTNGDTTDTDAKKGPHFLWQLTDVPTVGVGTETGLVHRTSSLGKTDMIALFGKNTGTPAVGMVDIKDNSGVDHQVGIAILPGGYESPPQTTGPGCARGPKSPSSMYSERPVRANVRQWSAAGCSAPVPGRGVTIVRLDNGEIIRHFGRKSQDIPQGIKDNVIETEFDSPMIGTPVVFPDQPGVPIQKVFIGDADGTLWRIDLTSTDSSQWHANLFEDLIGGIQGTTAPPSASQPIYVAPVLSTDDSGNLIINVATGDQESVVVSSDINYLWSIRENRNTSTFLPVAATQWYLAFNNSERVTGPMAVFDKVLYFASYLPLHPSSSGTCDALGTARTWGLDYVIPKDTSNIASGGASRWCKAGDVNPTTGLCAGSPVDEEDQGSDIIPGVSLQGSQACVTDSTDSYGNTSFSSITSTSYSLSFGIARPNSAGGTPPQADRKSIRRPLPQTQTRIDSWSIVVN